GCPCRTKNGYWPRHWRFNAGPPRLNAPVLTCETRSLHAPVGCIAPKQGPGPVPMLGQKARRIVGALSDTAADPDFPIAGDFGESRTHLGEGQVLSARYMAFGKLVRLAHIQKKGVRCRKSRPVGGGKISVQ